MSLEENNIDHSWQAKWWGVVEFRRNCRSSASLNFSSPLLSSRYLCSLRLSPTLASLFTPLQSEQSGIENKIHRFLAGSVRKKSKHLIYPLSKLTKKQDSSQICFVCLNLRKKQEGGASYIRNYFILNCIV